MVPSTRSTRHGEKGYMKEGTLKEPCKPKSQKDSPTARPQKIKDLQLRLLVWGKRVGISPQNSRPPPIILKRQRWSEKRPQSLLRTRPAASSNRHAGFKRRYCMSAATTKRAFLLKTPKRVLNTKHDECNAQVYKPQSIGKMMGLPSTQSAHTSPFLTRWMQKTSPDTHSPKLSQCQPPRLAPQNRQIDHTRETTPKNSKRSRLKPPPYKTPRATPLGKMPTAGVRKSPRTNSPLTRVMMDIEATMPSDLEQAPEEDSLNIESLTADYHAIVVHLTEGDDLKTTQELREDFEGIPKVANFVRHTLGERECLIITFNSKEDLDYATRTAKNLIGTFEMFDDKKHSTAAFTATVGDIPRELAMDRTKVEDLLHTLPGLKTVKLSIPKKGRVARAFLTFSSLAHAQAAKDKRCIALGDFICKIEAPHTLEPEPEEDCPVKTLYLHSLPENSIKAEAIRSILRGLKADSFTKSAPRRGLVNLALNFRQGQDTASLVGKPVTLVNVKRLLSEQPTPANNPDPQIPTLDLKSLPTSFPKTAQEWGSLLKVLAKEITKYLHNQNLALSCIVGNRTFSARAKIAIAENNPKNSPWHSHYPHTRNKNDTSSKPCSKLPRKRKTKLRHRESITNPQPSNYNQDGPEPERPKLKIGTWNVRGVSSSSTRARISNFVRNYDILLLQEIHAPHPKDLDDWNRSLKYRLRWSLGNTQQAGVAIYISPNTVNLEILENHTTLDHNGNYVAVTVRWYDQTLRIISTYLPANPIERTAKLEQMWADTTLWRPGAIIMGGDFNTCLDPELDSTGYTGDFSGWLTTNPPLANLITNHDLLDSWRIVNPEGRAYTWARSQSSAQRSRLDRIYISRALMAHLEDPGTRHTPPSISDHCIADLSIRCTTDVFIHKTTWKFSKELTLNNRWTRSISFLLKSYIERLETGHFCSPGEVIASYTKLKSCIRNKSKHCSIGIATTLKLQEEQANRRLQTIDAQLNNAPPETKNTLIAERQQINAFLEGTSRMKSESARIRSRATFCEEGEESTKYFFNMERLYSNRKSIYQLKKHDNTLTESSSSTMERAQQFYTDLYAPKPTTESAMKELLSLIDSGVPTSHPPHSDTATISEEETLRALKSLPSGKAPGQDGLTAEFYKAFPHQMTKILFYVFEASRKMEIIPEALSQCTICLLHKKGDITDLANWRPISLLNTDYKILTHAINERLKPLLKYCISPDQHGFIPGKKREDPIAFCLHTIRHCTRNEQEGSLLFLDQEKAFDRVDRLYMAKTLKAYNIPENIRTWVSLLYSNTPANISINNQLSSPVYLKSGVRQGCPLSPSLFALTIEPMANAIRKNPAIKGIPIPNGTAKIQMFADDTIFYCSAHGDVPRIVETLELYSAASGAKPNLNKTEILPIGPKRGGYIDYSPIKTLQHDTHVKLLGVQIANQPDPEKTWPLQFDKVKNLTQLWSRRNISTIGKLALIKQIMLSLIWHHTDIHNASDNDIKQLDDTIWSFFNNSKRSHISKEKARLPRYQGGYDFPDIKSTITAQRVHWVYDLITHRRDKVWYDLACRELDLLANSPGLGPDIIRLPKAPLSNDETLAFWKKNVQSFRKANIPIPQPTTRDEIRATHLTELGNRAKSLLKTNFQRVGDLTYAEAAAKPPTLKPADKLNLPKRIPKRPLKDLLEKVSSLSTQTVHLPPTFKISPENELTKTTPSIYRTLPFPKEEGTFQAKRYISTPGGRNLKETASPPKKLSTHHASLYQITVINGRTLGRTDKLPLSTTLVPSLPTKKKKGRTVYNRKEIYKHITKSPFTEHYHAPIWNEIIPDAEWRNVPNKRPFSGLPKYIDRLRMQIMHGSLPIGPRMNYLNRTRGPDERDATLCPMCNHKETIQHRFLDCNTTQNLWNALLLIWNRIFPGEDPSLQTMLFGPSYQKDIDYNQQAVADLLCGQMITAIWDDRKEYFDRPHKPHTGTSILISKWLWKVSYSLNNMVVARTLFRNSQRRWLHTQNLSPNTKFTCGGWPDQLKDLIFPSKTETHLERDDRTPSQERAQTKPHTQMTSKNFSLHHISPPQKCRSSPPEPP